MATASSSDDREANIIKVRPASDFPAWNSSQHSATSGA